MSCPIPEGQECPTCMRKVPRKKKPTSPVTKPKSQRVPVDDVDAWEVLEVETAKHLGVYEKPHWQYFTHHYAMVSTLNTPSLKDALSGDGS